MLEVIDLSNCNAITVLPELSGLTKLTTLNPHDMGLCMSRYVCGFDSQCKEYEGKGKEAKPKVDKYNCSKNSCALPGIHGA